MSQDRKGALLGSQDPSVRLYHEVAGSGPPLVLLHGLGSSCRDWELQVPRFSKNCTVIAPDLRGHGRSPKPKGKYSIPLMAQDVARLLEDLQTGPACIVGISMGGMVGMQLALDFPETASGMVLVNTCAEVRVRTSRERLQVWQRRLALEILGMRGVGALLAPRLFPHPHQAELRRVFKERWLQNDRQAYRKAMAAVVSWSAAERLGEVRCPTLVVSAEHDYLPQRLKKALADGIPGAQFASVADCHHGLPAEKPEEFNRIVLDFLNNWANGQIYPQNS
jgi:pimeloyl-ACP methyl ester carboxylesterase